MVQSDMVDRNDRDIRIYCLHGVQAVEQLLPVQILQHYIREIRSCRDSPCKYCVQCIVYNSLYVA